MVRMLTPDWLNGSTNKPDRGSRESARRGSRTSDEALLGVFAIYKGMSRARRQSTFGLPATPAWRGRLARAGVQGAYNRLLSETYPIS